jgi:hypothetical protein
MHIELIRDGEEERDGENVIHVRDTASLWPNLLKRPKEHGYDVAWPR